MISSIPTEEIHAVHDEDLEKIFDGLGVLSKFKRGELKCKFCNNTITFDDLHSFFPQSGDIKFVCEKASCVTEIYKLLREDEVAL